VVSKSVSNLSGTVVSAYADLYVISMGSVYGSIHSIFNHGNWSALHHHAACWLVNMHITWPFALQLP